MKEKNVLPPFAPRCMRVRRPVWISVLLFGLLLFLPTTSLSSPSAPLAGPTLVHPPDNIETTVDNYPPTGMPYFEWEPMEGAITYKLQIDGEIGFNQPIDYEISTPDTRHIPLLLDKFTDGVWYWRVQAQLEGNVWSDASDVRSFEKRWGSSDNVPQLIAPDADATIEFFEAPVFSWSRVPGAVDYVLRIDTDPDCALPVEEEYITLATHYNPGTRLLNGTYYWNVTPRDAKRREGEASACRQVTVEYMEAPQLLAPADGSFPVYTPRFEWTAVKGAVGYNLYYSTNSSFQGATKIAVYQTSYTPEGSWPNDISYYWRVTAVYGPYITWEGPFSEVWDFEKRWYQQPVNLTPRNNEQTNVALFTWTPVREANSYRIEGSLDAGFSKIAWSDVTRNTFYWFNEDWPATYWDVPMYWRVYPLDMANNEGKHSDVTTFNPVYAKSYPEAIYPRYYYRPPSLAIDNYASPYDIPISYDYTIAVPTFYWSRVFVPGIDPRQDAHHYKLEVSSNANFGTVDWTYTTQNLSATPTDGVPFVPDPGVEYYYWRVTAYSASGAVLTDTARMHQPWRTHIDTARLITPTATASPELQVPAQGEVMMDTLSSFQWSPQAGAARYEIELSTDPAFGTNTYITRTIYTQHTPAVRVPKGTYFWRVRGLDSGGATVGTWSETRRLVVAYQTRWSYASSYPAELLPDNTGTLLATDEEDKLSSTELSSLYAAQDKDNWYVGFHITPTEDSKVWYGLYVDANQIEGKGAASAPANRPSLTTSAYYQPEFAIYAVYSGTHFLTGTAHFPENVQLHTWDSQISAWDPIIKDFVEEVANSAFYYDPALNYVEMRIPKTAIGDLGAAPFVLSLSLFSAESQTAATAADTVPDNGIATAVLGEFKTIGDRVTLAVPVESAPGTPGQVPYTPYLYAETPNVDQLRGYQVEVAQDPEFSSILETQDLKCNGCENYVDIFQYVFSPLTVYSDNTLYWRYKIQHLGSGTDYPLGPPSEAHQFTKVGPVPGNLRTEGEYSTKTFVWDAVEGAGRYRLEIATNPDFSPLTVGENINHETYTPYKTIKVLAPGLYYWRVRAENPTSYTSDWSVRATVNITLPKVTIQTPQPGAIVHYAPTFTWDDVLLPADTPRWGSPNYVLQIAETPVGFSNPLITQYLDTNSWTPDENSKYLGDGTFYWRVAVRDAKKNAGPFTAVYSFTKQYPTVEIISPLSGATTGGFPTFSWTPVDGASGYRIEIYEDPQYAKLYYGNNTHYTMFTPVKQYKDAQYYWRVAMFDRNNKFGPWTNSILLVEAAPYKVLLPLVLRQ
ncbi:MAG: hypothetical protein JXA33_23270 [Anaerolineae bacterium]|nr:hypothetical protein [Anaerolineae bacterium]